MLIKFTEDYSTIASLELPTKNGTAEAYSIALSGPFHPLSFMAIIQTFSVLF
jgi:hypothetical protein